MTFEEAVATLSPAHPELAIIEPWHSGGTTKGGLVVKHSHDLPCVYGFVWRVHESYRGPVRAGQMVHFQRYQYELIAEGSALDSDGKWELAVININDIEAILPLEELMLESEDGK